MFALHGLFKSQIIPSVYGLLVGKKTSDYDQFFKLVVDQGDFNPESILTDFESGTIKSIKGFFPRALHEGCLFHLGQCIWRKVQEFGLEKRYQEDKPFHSNVKKLLALAFVPVADVIKAFELIADDWRAEEKRNWSKERGISNRTLKCLRLGWHQAFAKRVSIGHPTINKLADKIRLEQSKLAVDIVRMSQGCEPKPKNTAHRKLDERIKRLVDDYSNVDLGEYLKGVTANMSV